MEAGFFGGAGFFGVAGATGPAACCFFLLNSASAPAPAITAPAAVRPAPFLPLFRERGGIGPEDLAAAALAEGLTAGSLAEGLAATALVGDLTAARLP